MKIKVLLGFFIGLFTMGIVSTAYFSMFFEKRLKGLNENLKNFNY